MKNTHVEKNLPNAVIPIITEYNKKVAVRDAEHSAQTPTQVDWTDLARAAVTLGKAGDATDQTPYLQEVMAAKRAIKETLGMPTYIDERLLNEFAADVATAVDSRLAATVSTRDTGPAQRG